MQQAVIRPEPHVFNDYQDEKFESSVVTTDENVSLRKMVARQPTRVYITEQVTYPDEGGIFMKYKGVPYLRQGFVFPEAMNSINSLKQLTTLFLAVLKGKGIKGKIGNFLAHYCRIADEIYTFYDPTTQKIRKITLKDNRYRQSVQQLIKLINNFVENLEIKLPEDVPGDKNIGRVIGTMLEYDNAYHWRMEDIFSETTKEALIKNPRKEIKRLLEIYKTRETQGIEFKAEGIEKACRYLFLIPSVKKAFIKAVESIDVVKLGMTKGDSYFTMNYDGYNFQGKSLEERQKIWLAMTGGIPPERVYIPVQ